MSLRRASRRHGGFRALRRRPARLPARADAVLRAQHQLLQALRDGSFAPTAVAWGHDNRTCAVRVVGHGDSRRLELRVPGADVNPYLALAAMVAAGAARARARARARGADRRQRLRGRQAARADHAGRGATLFERSHGRAGGVRRGGRRALPQQRPRRARRVQRVRDRLGASTGVRAAVITDPSSPRSNRPPRSRRRWSGWGPRSSSACCRPARGCRPSASCASSSGSPARRCARR